MKGESKREKLLTADDVAYWLQVGVLEVPRLLAELAIQVGGKKAGLRWRRSEVEAWLEKQRCVTRGAA